MHIFSATWWAVVGVLTIDILNSIRTAWAFNRVQRQLEKLSASFESRERVNPT